MSSHSDQTHLPPPLDLSGWRKLPNVLMVGGGLLSLLGLILSPNQFGISWLVSFLFFYTIALGALFLVLVHHLSGAGWSVGIRRFCEHIASLLQWPLILLFLPVIIFLNRIYSWTAQNPTANNLVAAKLPVFTTVGFIVTSGIFFAILWLLTWLLTSHSLKQDKTGAVVHTRKMSFHSGWGIVAFGLVLTFSAALWMEGTSYEWFSCIYGVYFFSDIAWAGLAMVYIIAAILYRQRTLGRLLQPNYFYYLGVLFFGFTLFSAYTEFAQYFVVWNANVPQETFFYLIRERGNWWTLSMILIFGHFFLPFVIMIPVKIKSNLKIIVPVCLWALLMHFADLIFNVFPTLPENSHGYPLKWIWLPFGVLAFMGGFLAKIFIKKFNSHPVYPQRDPRLLEAMGVNQNIINDLTTGVTPTTGGNQ